MEAPGYLDLRELGRVVLHGAHYLVSEFLFIVIPQQIFTLKKQNNQNKKDILLPEYWDVWRGDSTFMSGANSNTRYEKKKNLSLFNLSSFIAP